MSCFNSSSNQDSNRLVGQHERSDHRVCVPLDTTRSQYAHTTSLAACFRNSEALSEHCLDRFLNSYSNFRFSWDGWLDCFFLNSYNILLSAMCAVYLASPDFPKSLLIIRHKITSTGILRVYSNPRMHIVLIVVIVLTPAAHDNSNE